MLIHTLSLDEGPYPAVPRNFSKQTEALVRRLGRRVVIAPEGLGFNDAAKRVSFTRVNGSQVSEHLPWVDELYRGYWLRLARLALQNEQLQPFDDPDSACLLNALTEPGDAFPVHNDKTRGSLVLGCSTSPLNNNGKLYISTRREVTANSGVIQSGSYEIWMDAGLGVIFDGTNKWHGSGTIGEDDPWRITLATSYNDPTQPIERPKSFDANRGPGTDGNVIALPVRLSPAVVPACTGS